MKSLKFVTVPAAALVVLSAAVSLSSAQVATTTATSTVSLTATTSVEVATSTVSEPILGVVTTVNPGVISVVAQIAPTVMPVAVPGSGVCPVVTNFMKAGVPNRQSDVLKLQAFLKSRENLDVDLTGTYDTKTEEAVKAFQKKYTADILGPWSASIPSGMVYLTTAKKINQIACNVPLSLNEKEMTVINSYKSKVAQAEVVTVGQLAPTGPATATQGVTATVTAPSQDGAAGTFEAGSDELTDQELSAEDLAAAGTVSDSVASRFWTFLKNLFR